MHRLRTLVHYLSDVWKRRRAAAAGAFVRWLSKRPTPTRSVRILYALVVTTYFLKRLLQDLGARNVTLSSRWFRHRLREIETNFLIRLIVWREWPIDRPFNMYEAYSRNNRLTAAEIRAMTVPAQRTADRPAISVVVPVYNASRIWLDRLVESVIAQTYDRWELILVDDGSTDPATWPALVDLAERDERITVHRLARNVGVVEATNQAIDLSSGAWIAFADHDDTLMPDALWWVARSTQEDPGAAAVYTDEEIFDDATGNAYPHLKPAFSPQKLTAYNYICHMLVVRRDLLDEVGRLRQGTEGAQDYDLILRLSERSANFIHIPRVLYRWHLVARSMSRQVDEKTRQPRAVLALNEVTRRVVQEHIDRLGISAQVDIVRNWARPCYLPVDHGLVSIIICTKDQPARLRRCIESIEQTPNDPRYEIIIIDNGSREPQTLRLLDQLAQRHRVERIENGPEGFNYSRLNNEGARRARGEFLLFLNDDTSARSPDWLAAMVAHAQYAGVGAVGARLLYPSGRNQHAGLVVGAMGWGPWHALVGIPGDMPAHVGHLLFPHNVSAVTGACMLTRRDLFLELGGFNESELGISFNDVDYCLRLVRRGYRVVYSAQSELIHEEGCSRGRFAIPREVAAMKARWDGYQDPYWNPNFSRLSPHFSLDPRRRSRGLGIVTRPRVRFLRSESDDATTVERIIQHLAEQGAIDYADRDEEADVVVIEGAHRAAEVESWSQLGHSVLWSLPGRVLLPTSATWNDRRHLLEAVSALKHPYQSIFSDPYSVGWLVAGLPRANVFLVPEPVIDPAVDETEEVDRDSLRARWSLAEDQLLVVGVVDEDDPLSADFLLDVAFQFQKNGGRNVFFLVALQGEWPDRMGSRLRKGVRRAGASCAVTSYERGLEAAADVVLLHAVVHPRPQVAMSALRSARPMVTTPLGVIGDVIHPPLAGLVAREFRLRDWVRAIDRLVADPSLREEVGRQGRYWLESRESFAACSRHWNELIVESAELRVDGIEAASREKPLTRKPILRSTPAKL